MKIIFTEARKDREGVKPQNSACFSTLCDLRDLLFNLSVFR
jgi:hypothetical protein